MALTATVTLTVPRRALAAAAALRSALEHLNAAGNGYDWSGDAAPYGMTNAALERVLGQMVGGDMEADGLADMFARYITGEMANNGENVVWQVTRGLCWDLAVTDDDGEPEVTYPAEGERGTHDRMAQRVTALALGA